MVDSASPILQSSAMTGSRSLVKQKLHWPSHGEWGKMSADEICALAAKARSLRLLGTYLYYMIHS